MKTLIVQSQDGVTLVGGGPVSRRDLTLAGSRAPQMVAVDGGADRLLAAGIMPEAVIGDFDSLSAHARQSIPQERQFYIAEQESTDFDKALRSVSAPFVLALGVWGARMDHGFAALNVLVRHRGGPCIVIGPKDVVFAAPPDLTLSLRPGDPLSLFPLADVSGHSHGLRWPIAGLNLSPMGRVGTSNEVSQPEVRLNFDRPGMLVILPRARIDAAISALVPKWSGRRRAL